MAWSSQSRSSSGAAGSSVRSGLTAALLSRTAPACVFVVITDPFRTLALILLSRLWERYQIWDRQSVDTIDLLLHPVRLRVVHAMSGGRTHTTSDLCARLPDVPKTTLYRHVGLLAEGGVLEVADEQRVHGAVERHYRLRRDRAV